MATLLDCHCHCHSPILSMSKKEMQYTEYLTSHCFARFHNLNFNISFQANYVKKNTKHGEIGD